MYYNIVFYNDCFIHEVEGLCLKCKTEGKKRTAKRNLSTCCFILPKRSLCCVFICPSLCNDQPDLGGVQSHASFCIRWLERLSSKTQPLDLRVRSKRDHNEEHQFEKEVILHQAST